MAWGMVTWPLLVIRIANLRSSKTLTGDAATISTPLSLSLPALVR